MVVLFTQMVSPNKIYEKERRGWNLYYDTLDAVETALGKNDTYANDLKRKAQTIIGRCTVSLNKR